MTDRPVAVQLDAAPAFRSFVAFGLPVGTVLPLWRRCERPRVMTLLCEGLPCFLLRIVPLTPFRPPNSSILTPRHVQTGKPMEKRL